MFLFIAEEPPVPVPAGSVPPLEEEHSTDQGMGIEMSYLAPTLNNTRHHNWENRGRSGGMHGRTIEGSSCQSDHHSIVHNTSLNMVASNTSVDFRTGMCGHMGLSSAVKDEHRNNVHYGVVHQRGEMRMMREHKGIGDIRPTRKIGLPGNDS